jgi:glycerophosphoryl diester phosphodiesterase
VKGMARSILANSPRPSHGQNLPSPLAKATLESMLVIAHRGANREALENSWNAFEVAVDVGSDRIELDVQLTKDGHAVVMHDDDIVRTTGKRARVSEMTRSELASVSLINGEKIPFLDEVVEKFLPRVEINIEIKGHSEELAEVVTGIVKGHPNKDGVIVSCFHAEPLVWIYRNCPEIKRACLWSRDTFSWPFFADLAPQVFLDKCGTNILHPHAGLVNENLMDQATARGWTVYAWMPMAWEEHDREGLWTALKTVGLHGLCTNHPRQLRSWLEEVAIDERQYRPHQGV